MFRSPRGVGARGDTHERAIEWASGPHAGGGWGLSGCGVGERSAVGRGRHAGVAADEQAQWLLYSALAGRQYDQAYAHAQRLQKLRALKPHEALWAYAAVTLGKNAAGLEEVKKAIREFRHDREYRWHARRALGEVSDEELLKSIWLWSQKAYANWMVGVHADASGDVAAAVQAYRAAARFSEATKCTQLARRWAKQLAATTQPAR